MQDIWNIGPVLTVRYGDLYAASASAVYAVCLDADHVPKEYAS